MVNKKINPFRNLFNKVLKKSVTEVLLNLYKFDDYGAVKGNEGQYMKGLKTTEAYTEELYIYGCVYLISNTIASIPLRIYKDEEKTEVIKNHPALMLFKKPNFKDSWYDIKESVSANLELDGNAFLAVGEGKPKSIYSLVSKLVKIVPSGKKKDIGSMEDLIKGYEYGERKGITDMLKPEEIIHEKKYSTSDSLRGMSPIKAGALNIDTTQEAKRQNYNIFANGMHQDTVLESDQPFDEITYTRLMDDLKKRNSGTEKAHLPMILFSALKYKNAGITPRDIEYITGLKMNREELCGFLYQVPIILLGVLENSSYSNIKEAKYLFYEFCIKPRLVKNRELYQKLIDKYNAGGYIDFDLASVTALQIYQKEQIEKAILLWNTGISIKNLNDMYHLGIPEYKGWDIGYLPFSVTPAGTGEKPTEPTKPPEEKPSEEEPKKYRTFEWTEEKKVIKWKQFEKITEKNENVYKSKLIPYFKEQEAEIISNLNKYKSITYKKLGDNTFTFVGRPIEWSGEKAINIESILFDSDGEIKKLKKISLPIHKNTAKQTAELEYELLDLDLEFDIDNPRIVKWLDSNALEKATEVIDTAKDKLKQQLIDGVNEGESIPELQKRIKDTYEQYEKLTESHTEVIARTEVNGASNEGALESYKQADIEKKGWLSARDARVRDSHRAMESKYKKGIPVDKDFVNDVTGGQGQAPGQLGTAEDDCNERCTIIPIVEGG